MPVVVTIDGGEVLAAGGQFSDLRHQPPEVVDEMFEAMRRGARDYIEKPWDNARLLAVMRAQVELGRALRRTQRLEAQVQRQRSGLPQLIGDAETASGKVVLDIDVFTRRFMPRCGKQT